MRDIPLRVYRGLREIQGRTSPDDTRRMVKGIEYIADILTIYVLYRMLRDFKRGFR